MQIIFFLIFWKYTLHKCLNSDTADIYLTLYDGDPCHIETSPLIHRAIQFNSMDCPFMIGNSIMKELKIAQ